jgi:hypothetical protein
LEIHTSPVRSQVDSFIYEDKKEKPQKEEKLLLRLHFMAGPTRLELATSGVTGRRSNQLNYDPTQFTTISVTRI